MVSLGLNGQPDQTVTPRRLLMGHHGKCRGRNRKCGQLGACALTPLNRKNCERACICVTYSVPEPEHCSLIHLSHSAVPHSSSIIQDPRYYVVLICWFFVLLNLITLPQFAWEDHCFPFLQLGLPIQGFVQLYKPLPTLLWISLIPSQTCTSICQT